MTTTVQDLQAELTMLDGKITRTAKRLRDELAVLIDVIPAVSNFALATTELDRLIARRAQVRTRLGEMGALR